MSVLNIVLLILALIVIYYVIKHFMKKNKVLSTTTSASTMQTISASNFQNSGGDSSTGSTNFTYSIWVYINDWNYKYGEIKPILGRMSKSSSSSSSSVEGLSGSGPCPLIVLGALSNNLEIFLSTFASSTSDTSPTVDDSTGQNVSRSVVNNIPIQKWVNILISVYGKTMDIYIDGKLVKTVLLEGVPKINNDADVYITPKGGFSGYTSKLQYFSDATDPQKAYNIYLAGPGGSIFSNLSSGYQLQMSLVQNGQVNGTITI
jgi:hypothetical protein